MQWSLKSASNSEWKYPSRLFIVARSSSSRQNVFRRTCAHVFQKWKRVILTEGRVMTPRETRDSHLSPISNHYFPTGLSRSLSCASLRRLWRTLSVISSLFLLLIFSGFLACPPAFQLVLRKSSDCCLNITKKKKKEKKRRRRKGNNEKLARKWTRNEEKIQQSTRGRERKIHSYEWKTLIRGNSSGQIIMFERKKKNTSRQKDSRLSNFVHFRKCN